MCDPLSAIAAGAFALNAGSAVAGHAAQNKAAKKNEEAAREAWSQSIKDINLLETEVRSAASQNIFQAERQARAARALARVSAGEAGVEGMSVDALEGQFERDAAEFKVATLRQAERQVRQLEREKISGRQIMQNRIATVGPANPWLTGLQIGSSALQFGYQQSTRNRTPASTTPSGQ